MTDSNPQTYAADRDWRAYSGVLSRRAFAFIIDYLILGALWLVAAVVVFFLGIVTFGLGFMLYPILFFLLALVYFGVTVSGPAQASLGMRAVGLRLGRDDGRPIDFLTAIVHLTLFWLFNSILTPLVLLVGLFTDRSRLLHDILLGTAMMRSFP